MTTTVISTITPTVRVVDRSRYTVDVSTPVVPGPPAPTADTVVSTLTSDVRVEDTSRQSVDVLLREVGPPGPPGPQGLQGPQGERGVQNLVVSDTPPTDTSVVWVDTSQLTL